MALKKIADVDLDPQGVFKYILIKEEKWIVRGYARCPYHADILEQTRRSLGADVALECVGGGRIKHDPEHKELFVYGYSQGFGRADHRVTVDILKKHFAGYSVSFSNEGY